MFQYSSDLLNRDYIISRGMKDNKNSSRNVRAFFDPEYRKKRGGI